MERPFAVGYAPFFGVRNQAQSVVDFSARAYFSIFYWSGAYLSNEAADRESSECQKNIKTKPTYRNDYVVR